MTTVLLVEDKISLAQVVLRELESAGYATVHAADKWSSSILYLAGPGLGF